MAARTRRAPELWAGLFFVGAGVGMPLRVLGASRAVHAPDVALVLNAWGHLCFACGAAALLVFTRTVFRPQSRAAAVGCGAAIAAIGISTALVFASGSVNDEHGLSVLVANTARAAAVAWAFAESLRYARLMRRRVELGIADALVADRFRLWALWTGVLAIIPLLTALARVIGKTGLVVSVDNPEHFARVVAVVIGTVRACLVVSAPLALYGIWMSFFPPARYVERVRARARARGAGLPAA